jgi:2-oxoisovalerate dehydrogenase E1 component
MFNRAEIVDQRFIESVKNQNFPPKTANVSLEEANLSKEKFIELFESQISSRLLDIQARILKEDNESYYTIGSSGHEGNAVLGEVFKLKDMAFLHYRSGALMMQRAKQLPGSTPLYDTLLSFVASADDPISSGRHKVFGSLELNVPPQTSTIASHVPKAVGAAFSIDKARLHKFENRLEDDSVIFCNFGDASLNHSTAQGAINTAGWISYRKIPLPLVFICEDNGLGISVKTPHGWVENSMKNRPGIKYFQTDGLDLVEAYKTSRKAVEYARKHKKPVFLHMRTVRMLGHAGSDIELLYHNVQIVENVEKQDPLLHSARIAIENNILTADEILELYESQREQIAKISAVAIKKPKLTTAEQVMESILPEKRDFPEKKVSEEERKNAFGKLFPRLKKKTWNLSQHINYALIDLMKEYSNIVLFGEDVAKKGGVYHVTTGLNERFGGNRVFNTLLDEQSILGTAIGMAHNGFLPIPEIQFLAYYHNAEDQIRGEAATLSFFSSGKYTNPMIIRVASFAYQKGFGGHFHNDNSIAAIRDLPGVIIATPSNGDDAAKMLRTCVKIAEEEQKVIFFLEPIALYKTKDLLETGDDLWASSYSEPNEKIELEEVGLVGQGKTLIITFANGFYLSRQAQEILKKEHKTNIKVMDLRWLAPLPEKAILEEAKKCERVLIVDENRETASQSEQIITLLVEKLDKLPKIKRLTGHDSFIPLGKAWEFVLPNTDRIVDAVLEMEGMKNV